jgi:hypothetical protein
VAGTSIGLFGSLAGPHLGNGGILGEWAFCRPTHSNQGSLPLGPLGPTDAQGGRQVGGGPRVPGGVGSANTTESQRRYLIEITWFFKNAPFSKNPTISITSSNCRHSSTNPSGPIGQWARQSRLGSEGPPWFRSRGPPCAECGTPKRPKGMSVNFSQLGNSLFLI